MTPLLSLLVIVPLLGAGLVAMMPSREPGVAKALALAVAAVEVGLGWNVLMAFDPDVAGPQLAQVHAWIEPLGLHLRVAIDGLSLSPVLLTVVVIPLALLGGWDHVRAQGRELGVPLLVFESGALAVLLAEDVGLMFAGWELAAFAAWALLLPSAEPFERRWADRWLIGTQLAAGAWATAVLVAAITYYDITPGEWSLRLSDLAQIMLPAAQQQLAFAAVAVAVALSVGLFPVHAWVPAFACVRSPVAAVVPVVVLVELGVHLLGRVGVGLFPLGAVDLGPIVAALALIGIVHAGLALRVEPRLGRIAGYVVVALGAAQVIGVLTMHSDATLGAGLLGSARGLGVLAFLLVVAAVRRSVGSDLVERGASSPGRGLMVSMAVPALAGFAGLLAIVAGGQADTAVGLPDAASVTVLAAVGSIFVFALALGRVTSRGPGRVMDRRESITVAVAVVVALGLGVQPVEAFLRGTWTARERAAQAREHVCVGEAARALTRAERYDGLAVDCEGVW